MADGIKKSGGISFGVSMVTSQLGKDTKTARGMIGGFVSDTKSKIATLKSAFSGLRGHLTAAFSTAAIGSFVKSQFQAIDALYDTAKTLGVTTDALTGYGHAAAQSGSSQESLERGLARMVKTTRDATLGLETAARAYGILGLNAFNLHKMSPEQQFLAIADAIKKLKAENDQLTVTQDIFGRSSKDLVETLRLGSAGLSAMKIEAEGLGIAVNQIDAERIAKAADAVDRMKKAFGGLGNELAITIGPHIEKMANEIVRAVKILRSLENANGRSDSWGAGIQEMRDGFTKARDTVTQGIGAIASWMSYMSNNTSRAVPGSFANRMFGDGNASSFSERQRWFWEDFARNLGFAANGGPPPVQKRTGNATQTAARSSFFASRKRELQNLLGTPRQIWEGLSSPIAKAQRQIGLAELNRAGSTWRDRPKSDILGGIWDSLMQTGMGRNATQIFQGMRDSPIAQLQRQLFGANLKASMAGTQTVRRPVGSFDAVESGSLAAYQQRIRGQQQFEKVEVKQLKEAQEANDWLEAIATGLKGIVAEGSV